MKIAVFFHICDMVGKETIHTEIVSTLEKRLLGVSQYYYEKLCAPENFEFPTLNMVREFSIENPGYAVLYVHTKGISRPGNECVVGWRRSMMYHLVEKYEYCIDRLKICDTVGCNYTKHHEYAHWQGNFFWGKSDYIATLKPVEEMDLSSESRNVWTDRHKAEAWIFSGLNTTFHEVYSHGFDPYHTKNPYENYTKYIRTRKNIVFKKAVYCGCNGSYDVLEKIKENYYGCLGNVMILSVDNDLCGDPDPGYKKRLYLEYFENGKLINKVVNENDVLYMEVWK